MKKKLFCIVLSLAMVVTFMPAMAMTAFGATVTEVTSIAALQTALNKGGTIKLTDDIYVDNTDLTIPSYKTVTLNLNDHLLSLGNDYDLCISKNAKLTIVEDENSVVHKGKVISVDSQDWIVNNGTLVIEDGEISVPIDNYGTLTVNGGLFTDQSFNSCIYNNPEGNCTINGGEFTGVDFSISNPTYCGASVYNDTGKLTINGGNFSENVSCEGGAVYNWKGTAIVNGGTFTNNVATDCGGAIYSEEGTLTVKNATFVGNKANGKYGCGGAIYTSDPTTVDNCTFNGNIAVDEGGAICNDANKLDITKSTFKNNEADYGGAISIWKDYQARLTLPVSLADCTITNNKANNCGGGVNCWNGVELTIAGDTIINGNECLNEDGVYVKNNIEFPDAEANTIKTKNLGTNAKVGVFFGIGDKATFFDPAADLTPFVSDLSLLSFGTASEDAIVTAIKDANVILDTLAACYKLMGLTENVGTAQEYKDEINGMLDKADTTVEKINAKVDEAAKVMFGYKIGAIADLLKLVGKGTITTALVTAKITAELAEIAGNVAANVLDFTGETIKTVLETKAKLAAVTAAVIVAAKIVKTVKNSVSSSIQAAQKQAQQKAAAAAMQALLQKLTQKTGVALVGGAQIGGQLLNLLAAGKIATTVAALVANSVYYIGAATNPYHYYYYYY